MRRTLVLQVLLTATSLFLAAQAPAPPSTNTDPKAGDLNGNGPPGWVYKQGQGDNQPTKEEKKASATERPVSGVVSDANGKPVSGAVVQLKNTRTLQVRSFITRDKGDYYFSGLSKDVDYELKAQANGHASPSKTLSSFDSKA